MPIVRTLVQTYAGEEVLQEIMEAANATAGTPNAAEIVRDANGKLVRLDVNLPEGTSQADLINAKDAIQNNPGVAKASPFPILIPGGDMETAYTNPADALTSFGDAQFKADFISSGGAIWEGSAAAEAITGSKAARLYRSSFSSTFNNTTAQTRISAVNNGLLGFKAFSLEFDMKVSNTRDAVAQDIGATLSSARIKFQQNGIGIVGTQIDFAGNQSTNWHLLNESDFSSVDLGIPITSPVHVKLEVTTAGLWTVTATDSGSALHTVSKLFAPAVLSNIDMNFQKVDVGTGMTTQRPIIVDNYVITLLDGE